MLVGRILLIATIGRTPVPGRLGCDAPVGADGLTRPSRGERRTPAVLKIYSVKIALLSWVLCCLRAQDRPLELP